MPTCSVCSHTQRAAIEAAVTDGTSFRMAAEQYGISTTALHRHMHDHATAPEPEQAAEQAEPTPAERLQQAQERIAALRDDERTLPERIQRALQHGDAATLSSLRRRESELPDEITLATLAVARLELADLDAQIAAARDEAEQCRLTAPALEAQWREARQAADEAERAYRLCANTGRSALVRSEIIGQQRSEVAARLKVLTDRALSTAVR